MAATYDAIQIADWFVRRGRADYNMNFGELVSNLKVQKLLYYAQGCYLAIYNEPLFNEPLEAWEHGPVVSTVYSKYKEHGCKGILKTFGSVDINESTSKFLEEVYNVFGQYSAWKLREMTHAEKPWNETPRGGLIDNELIRSYFLSHHISK